MAKARNKSERLEEIGCNADEKTLAATIVTMPGITRKTLQFAMIAMATKGRISIKSKAAALGLTMEQYRVYAEALSLEPSFAERLLAKWATQTPTPTD
jgi:hypothetical protein